MLGEHYAGIRRWTPTFLDAFVFQGVPAAALMRAIDMLRDMNRRAVLTLPKSAPISFIREGLSAIGFWTAFWEEWGDGGATTAPVTGFASNRGLLRRQIGPARLV
jgi:hypothetical protein